MTDITDQGIRSNILDEINLTENKERKAESLRRHEVFRGDQRQWILERLTDEFSTQTVNEMRTITSINLTKRIVNEQASIYKSAPRRTFTDSTEETTRRIESIYQSGAFDIKFKKANRVFKYQDQCAIQIIPKDGKIVPRVFQPHHYDVIPSKEDPERAEVYIINLLDKKEFQEQFNDLKKGRIDQRFSDGIDQTIGDPEDYKPNTQRFAWWSADWNFITDGNGALVTELLENPIKKLPFIDVAMDKDFEFWTRNGSTVVDFSLDYGVLLSDTANTARMQSYAQAVIAAKDKPQGMQLGPQHVLWLQLQENSEIQPTFSFESPSPNLEASLELLEVYLKNFLTTQGLDPTVVSGKLQGQAFSSGIERMLAMIEKFEASRDDLDLFKLVELQAFDLIKCWDNALQGTDGPGSLMEELRGPAISTDIKLNIEFAKPELLQTKQEKLSFVREKLESGLMSKVQAIMELEGVDRERAKEIISEIDGDLLGQTRVQKVQSDSDDQS